MNEKQNSGLVLIDKQESVSSFKEISKLRKLTGVKRVGHSGTLDPIATGLLVTAFGKATKLLKYCIGLDKEYIAEIKLGESTDTYDREGRLVDHTNFVFDEVCFKSVISSFIGEIMQKPPIFSAIKINGQKSYELARKSEIFELPSRKVTVNNIEIVNIDLPFVTLKINCSSGTYIRSIAHDIGHKTGYLGFINNLRRSRVGGFSIENSVAIDCFDPTRDVKNEIGLIDFMPSITIKDEFVNSIMNGKSISINWFNEDFVSNSMIFYKVLSSYNKLLAVIKSDGIIFNYDIVY